MASYSVADAKNSFSQLLERARDGEEVVITKHGKPFVEFRPAKSPRKGKPSDAYKLLIANRLELKGTSIDSVELLNSLYEDPDA